MMPRRPVGRSAQRQAVPPPAASTWTFLSNHAHVLIALARDPEARVRDVAVQVGITERAVQRLIADLLQAGCLRVTRVGRRNRYEIDDRQPLRHPMEAHHPLRDLIALGR
jgi:DNA-binding IclR family transcriptional regulator